MASLDQQLYINAYLVYGIGRSFSVSLNQATAETQNDSQPTFEPMDLSQYSIRFRVLGSATGDGVILLEKIINQVTDPSTIGQIESPESGLFTFVITADDTKMLGLGAHPITIELLDIDTGENAFTLTSGGIFQGEFNKIIITNV